MEEHCKLRYLQNAKFLSSIRLNNVTKLFSKKIYVPSIKDIVSSHPKLTVSNLYKSLVSYTPSADTTGNEIRPAVTSLIKRFKTSIITAMFVFTFYEESWTALHNDRHWHRSTLLICEYAMSIYSKEIRYCPSNYLKDESRRFKN